ncbi:MAG: hypothetical protein B6D77_03250 [gamma proteobacterium symbiont of Ctena orbiculata]|nr:MAG: hypothetical protein B6D77_03250 [gamma proteobacterium symbiont of Ctena orbiculata]
MKPEQRTDSYERDQASAYGLRDLRLTNISHQDHRSLIILAHNSEDLVQVFRHSLSSPISSYKPLWLDVSTLKECESVNHTDTIESPILLQHLQTFRRASGHPVALDTELDQSATFSSLLQDCGKDLFILDSGWKELPTHYDLIEIQEDSPLNNNIYFGLNADENTSVSRQQLYTEIKQRMIEIRLLKRTLAIAKIRLSTADDKLHERLEAREDIGRQNIEQMQQNQLLLEQELENSRKQIAHAQEESQEKESSRQKLQQDKADLANYLQIETSRTLEFAHQAQSMEEHKHRLEKELSALQQAGKDAALKHQNEMVSLREELEERLQQSQADSMKLQAQMNQAVEAEKQHTRDEQTRLKAVIEELNQQLEADHAEADRQLNEAQQQAQTEYQALQERMNQALEAEKQHTKEEQTRFKASIDELNKKLQDDHVEADRQRKEAQQQAQLEYQTLQERMDQALEVEKQQAREEKSRLETVIEGLNDKLEATRTEAGQLRDRGIEQEALLEQEHKTTNSLRHLLKRTKKMLDNRRKQLAEAERIQQETLSELQQELKTSQEAWEKVTESEVATQVAKQELTSLRRELEGEVINLRAQLEHHQESSDNTVSQLREENERLQKSLSEIKEGSKMTDVTIRKLRSDRHYLRETKSRIEDQLAKMKAEAVVTQEENELLRQEVDAAKSENEDAQALRRAEEQNTALKREIEGLREVQLEMESQFNEDTDSVVRELRNRLKTSEFKLKKAEKLAQQTKDLLRERETMENAIELLGDDLDTLTKEKEGLILVCDRLKRELTELQGR